MRFTNFLFTSVQYWQKVQSSLPKLEECIFVTFILWTRAASGFCHQIWEYETAIDCFATSILMWVCHQKLHHISVTNSGLRKNKSCHLHIDVCVQSEARSSTERRPELARPTLLPRILQYSQLARRKFRISEKSRRGNGKGEVDDQNAW